jgi:hypothetical protein
MINNELIDNTNSYLNEFIENNKNKLNVSSYIYADCINIYYNKKIEIMNEKLRKIKEDNDSLRLFLYGFIIGGLIEKFIYFII